MYLLTDYPEDHLRIFSRMAQDKIEELLYNMNHPLCMPESYERHRRELSAVRKHYVHLLIALQIRRNQELTTKQ